MNSLNRFADPVYCIMRLILGLAYACHGGQKILGYPGGGHGVDGLAFVAGIIELVGGLLIAFGLFTRIAAFLASGEMAVAYFMFYVGPSPILEAKVFPIMNGGELALVYCWVFFFFIFYGPGRWSIDAQWGKNRSRNSAASSAKALILLAVFSLSGSLRAQSSDWKAPPSAANRPNPVPLNATTIAFGQKLYVGNCVICHGTAGRGDGPGAAALEKKPADLVARIKAGETDGALFWKITEGRSPMLSWRGSLSETQRWELVNYIKSLAGK